MMELLEKIRLLAAKGNGYMRYNIAERYDIVVETSVREDGGPVSFLIEARQTDTQKHVSSVAGRYDERSLEQVVMGILTQISGCEKK